MLSEGGGGGGGGWVAFHHLGPPFINAYSIHLH